jgi:hypothetical protein
VAATLNSVGGFLVAPSALPLREYTNVSDRKLPKHHLDKRAEDILDKLIREKLSDDQLLSKPQTATLLGVSIPWLDQRRLRKEGPRYIKISEAVSNTK